MEPVEGDHGLNRLDRLAAVCWQTENAVAMTVLMVLVGVGTLTPVVPDRWRQWALVVAGLALVVTVLEAVVLIPLRYRFYRYALLPDRIVVERGRLWRRRQVLPLARVLSCESRRGPVLDRYDLRMVKVGTIVDGCSIGPLTREEAAAFEAAIGGRRD